MADKQQMEVTLSAFRDDVDIIIGQFSGLVTSMINRDDNCIGAKVTSLVREMESLRADIDIAKQVLSQHKKQNEKPST